MLYEDLIVRITGSYRTPLMHFSLVLCPHFVLKRLMFDTEQRNFVYCRDSSDGRCMAGCGGGVQGRRAFQELFCCSVFDINRYGSVVRESDARDLDVTFWSSQSRAMKISRLSVCLHPSNILCFRLFSLTHSRVVR